MKKQFRNRRNFKAARLVGIKLQVALDFERTFSMTPRQSRFHYDEINTSIYSSAGYRTALLKHRFGFWTHYLNKKLKKHE